jgi:hypothetical protein
MPGPQKELTVAANPDQAREYLRKLCEQIQDHLREYEPHETLASAELLQWFLDGATTFLKSGVSLDQSLGLKRKRGRPKLLTPGKHHKLALKVFELRSKKKSWTYIGRALDFEDQRELQRIYERELPFIQKDIASQLADLSVERLKKRLELRTRPPTKEEADELARRAKMLEDLNKRQRPLKQKAMKKLLTKLKTESDRAHRRRVRKEAPRFSRPDTVPPRGSK